MAAGGPRWLRRPAGGSGRAHEKVVLEGGLTEDHVHDAVRIAAVVHAAAVALELGATQAPVAA